MAQPETTQAERELQPPEERPEAPPPISAAPSRHSAPTRDPSPPQARTPFLAALFSFFPGLGNVYNGLYLRGITFFFIIVGLIALTDGAEPPEGVILGFAIAFTWLFNIFDAYRQATMINYGFAPELDWPGKKRAGSWGSGGLVAGIAVFLVGFYGFLREVLNLDLSFLAEHWYVLFMAFGGFLIYRTVKEKKRAEEADGDAGAELEGI